MAASIRGRTRACCGPRRVRARARQRDAQASSAEPGRRDRARRRRRPRKVASAPVGNFSCRPAEQRPGGRGRPAPRPARRCPRCGRSAGRCRTSSGTARRRASSVASEARYRPFSSAIGGAGAASRWTSGASVWRRPHGRRAQDQVGPGALMHDVVGHGLGGPLAAPVQRPLVVVQPGLAPGRFRMAQEENGLHWRDPGKSFGNNCLVNCHDTVMRRRLPFL